MTLDELIDRCRNDSGDEASPYHCSDADWTKYLNEAEEESCIRARLIEEVVDVALVAGDDTITVPARAFSIHSAAIAGRSLDLYTLRDLNDLLPDGWDDDEGEVVACARHGNLLRLYRIPVASGDVRLTAFCTPENPMVNGSDVPTIHSRYHVKLVDWALRCAYSKQNNDLYDKDLADRHEGRFERTFGPRPNEVEMRRTAIRRQRPARGNFV